MSFIYIRSFKYIHYLEGDESQPQFFGCNEGQDIPGELTLNWNDVYPEIEMSLLNNTSLFLLKLFGVESLTLDKAAT